jgi:hypothetical protein
MDEFIAGLRGARYNTKDPNYDGSCGACSPLSSDFGWQVITIGAFT